MNNRMNELTANIQNENEQAYKMTVERLQRHNDRAPLDKAKPIPTYEQWLNNYANAAGELVSAIYQVRGVSRQGRRFPQYLAAAA